MGFGTRRATAPASSSLDVDAKSTIDTTTAPATSFRTCPPVQIARTPVPSYSAPSSLARPSAPGAGAGAERRDVGIIGNRVDWRGQLVERRSADFVGDLLKRDSIEVVDADC